MLLMTEDLSIKTIMTSQTYKQNLEAAYDEMEELTKKWDDECHWCESSKELPTFKWFYTHEEWLIHAEICNHAWTRGYIKMDKLSMPEQFMVKDLNKKHTLETNDMLDFLDDVIVW